MRYGTPGNALGGGELVGVALRLSAQSVDLVPFRALRVSAVARGAGAGSSSPFISASRRWMAAVIPCSRNGYC